MNFLKSKAWFSILLDSQLTFSSECQPITLTISDQDFLLSNQLQKLTKRDHSPWQSKWQDFLTTMSYKIWWKKRKWRRWWWQI